MLNVISGLKNIFKVKTINTDGFIFRLHYGLTVLLLIFFSIIVTTEQLAGHPINCFSKGDKVLEVINLFCWIHSTFTVPTVYHGDYVPYPGISNSKDSKNVKYFKYYQWVGITLFIQAVLFYFPKWLWKYCEQQKLKSLILNLKTVLTDKTEPLDLLLNYFEKNVGYHNFYAFSYYFCELLALVNIIFQLYFTNLFFDGTFLNYGLDIIKFVNQDPEERIDPMIKIFPRITKCMLYKYGPSGDIEKYDYLCILPLNIINEKIYIFLWFWFIFLAVLTSIKFISSLLNIFYPPSRVFAIRFRFQMIHPEQLIRLAYYVNYADWFLISLIKNNLDTYTFDKFIVGLNTNLKINGPRQMSRNDEYI